MTHCTDRSPSCTANVTMMSLCPYIYIYIQHIYRQQYNKSMLGMAEQSHRTVYGRCRGSDLPPAHTPRRSLLTLHSDRRLSKRTLRVQQAIPCETAPPAGRAQKTLSPGAAPHRSTSSDVSAMSRECDPGRCPLHFPIPLQQVCPFTDSRLSPLCVCVSLWMSPRLPGHVPGTQQYRLCLPITRL